MTLVEWRGLSERGISSLIARLNDAREVGEDGKITYSGDPFFEDVVGVIESALRFPEEIPEVESRRAVSAGLFALRSEPLDGEFFRAQIGRYVAAFLESTVARYVLVTSISARYFTDLESTELSGCRMAFHNGIPEPFKDGHRQAEDRMRPLVPGDYGPSSFFNFRYTFVTVEAEGRSEYEAAIKAKDALTLQRGIWNLALFHHAPQVGGTRPLNHILPGPVESLHYENGKVLLWPVWYEPDYVGAVDRLQAGRLEQHWDGVREYEGAAREGLAACRYRDAVEDFIRDYSRILDGRDPEAAFIGLWGLLERVVGLARGERHTEVTKRAAFLVRSELRGLQYLVLESLRRHRNTGVHQGTLPDDARDLLRQLRKFVVFGLELRLDPRFDFAHPEEAARFLEQPSEPEPLRQRIAELEREGGEEDLRLARMALEYHGHGS